MSHYDSNSDDEGRKNLAVDFQHPITEKSELKFQENEVQFIPVEIHDEEPHPKCSGNLSPESSEKYYSNAELRTIKQFNSLFNKVVVLPSNTLCGRTGTSFSNGDNGGFTVKEGLWKTTDEETLKYADSKLDLNVGKADHFPSECHSSLRKKGTKEIQLIEQEEHQSNGEEFQTQAVIFHKMKTANYLKKYTSILRVVYEEKSEHSESSNLKKIKTDVIQEGSYKTQDISDQTPLNETTKYDEHVCSSYMYVYPISISNNKAANNTKNSQKRSCHRKLTEDVREIKIRTKSHKTVNLREFGNPGTSSVNENLSAMKRGRKTKTLKLGKFSEIDFSQVNFRKIFLKSPKQYQYIIENFSVVQSGLTESREIVQYSYSTSNRFESALNASCKPSSKSPVTSQATEELSIKTKDNMIMNKTTSILIIKKLLRRKHEELQLCTCKDMTKLTKQSAPSKYCNKSQRQSVNCHSKSIAPKKITNQVKRRDTEDKFQQLLDRILGDRHSTNKKHSDQNAPPNTKRKSSMEKSVKKPKQPNKDDKINREKRINELMTAMSAKYAYAKKLQPVEEKTETVNSVKKPVSKQSEKRKQREMRIQRLIEDLRRKPNCSCNPCEEKFEIFLPEYTFTDFEICKCKSLTSRDTFHEESENLSVHRDGKGEDIGTNLEEKIFQGKPYTIDKSTSTDNEHVKDKLNGQEKSADEIKDSDASADLQKEHKQEEVEDKSKDEDWSLDSVEKSTEPVIEEKNENDQKPELEMNLNEEESFITVDDKCNSFGILEELKTGPNEDTLQQKESMEVSKDKKWDHKLSKQYSNALCICEKKYIDKHSVADSEIFSDSEDITDSEKGLDQALALRNEDNESTTPSSSSVTENDYGIPKGPASERVKTHVSISVKLVVETESLSEEEIYRDMPEMDAITEKGEALDEKPEKKGEQKDPTSMERGDSFVESAMEEVSNRSSDEERISDEENTMEESKPSTEEKKDELSHAFDEESFAEEPRTPTKEKETDEVPESPDQGPLIEMTQKSIIGKEIDKLTEPSDEDSVTEKPKQTTEEEKIDKSPELSDKEPVTKMPQKSTIEKERDKLSEYSDEESESEKLKQPTEEKKIGKLTEWSDDESVTEIPQKSTIEKERDKLSEYSDEESESEKLKQPTEETKIDKLSEWSDEEPVTEMPQKPTKESEVDKLPELSNEESETDKPTKEKEIGKILKVSDEEYMAEKPEELAETSDENLVTEKSGETMTNDKSDKLSEKSNEKLVVEESDKHTSDDANGMKGDDIDQSEKNFEEKSHFAVEQEHMEKENAETSSKNSTDIESSTESLSGSYGIDSLKLKLTVRTKTADSSEGVNEEEENESELCEKKEIQNLSAPPYADENIRNRTSSDQPEKIKKLEEEIQEHSPSLSDDSANKLRSQDRPASLSSSSREKMKEHPHSDTNEDKDEETRSPVKSSSDLSPSGDDSMQKKTSEVDQPEFMASFPGKTDESEDGKTPYSPGIEDNVEVGKPPDESMEKEKPVADRPESLTSFPKRIDETGDKFKEPSHPEDNTEKEESPDRSGPSVPISSKDNIDIKGVHSADRLEPSYPPGDENNAGKTKSGSNFLLSGDNNMKKRRSSTDRPESTPSKIDSDGEKQEDSFRPLGGDNDDSEGAPEKHTTDVIATDKLKKTEKPSADSGEKIPKKFALNKKFNHENEIETKRNSMAQKDEEKRSGKGPIKKSEQVREVRPQTLDEQGDTGNTQPDYRSSKDKRPPGTTNNVQTTKPKSDEKPKTKYAIVSSTKDSIAPGNETSRQTHDSRTKTSGVKPPGKLSPKGEEKTRKLQKNDNIKGDSKKNESELKTGGVVKTNDSNKGRKSSGPSKHKDNIDEEAKKSPDKSKGRRKSFERGSLSSANRTALERTMRDIPKKRRKSSGYSASGKSLPSETAAGYQANRDGPKKRRHSAQKYSTNQTDGDDKISPDRLKRRKESSEKYKPKRMVFDKTDEKDSKTRDSSKKRRKSSEEYPSNDMKLQHKKEKVEQPSDKLQEREKSSERFPFKTKKIKHEGDTNENKIKKKIKPSKQHSLGREDLENKNLKNKPRGFEGERKIGVEETNEETLAGIRKSKQLTPEADKRHSVSSKDVVDEDIGKDKDVIKIKLNSGYLEILEDVALSKALEMDEILKISFAPKCKTELKITDSRKEKGLVDTSKFSPQKIGKLNQKAYGSKNLDSELEWSPSSLININILVDDKDIQNETKMISPSIQNSNTLSNAISQKSANITSKVKDHFVSACKRTCNKVKCNCKRQPNLRFSQRSIASSLKLQTNLSSKKEIPSESGVLFKKLSGLGQVLPSQKTDSISVYSNIGEIESVNDLEPIEAQRGGFIKHRAFSGNEVEHEPSKPKNLKSPTTSKHISYNDGKPFDEIEIVDPQRSVSTKHRWFSKKGTTVKTSESKHMNSIGINNVESFKDKSIKQIEKEVYSKVCKCKNTESDSIWGNINDSDAKPCVRTRTNEAQRITSVKHSCYSEKEEGNISSEERKTVKAQIKHRCSSVKEVDVHTSASNKGDSISVCGNISKLDVETCEDSKIVEPQRGELMKQTYLCEKEEKSRGWKTENISSVSLCENTNHLEYSNRLKSYKPCGNTETVEAQKNASTKHRRVSENEESVEIYDSQNTDSMKLCKNISSSGSFNDVKSKITGNVDGEVKQRCFSGEEHRYNSGKAAFVEAWRSRNLNPNSHIRSHDLKTCKSPEEDRTVEPQRACKKHGCFKGKQANVVSCVSDNVNSLSDCRNSYKQHSNACKPNNKRRIIKEQRTEKEVKSDNYESDNSQVIQETKTCKCRDFNKKAVLTGVNEYEVTTKCRANPNNQSQSDNYDSSAEKFPLKTCPRIILSKIDQNHATMMKQQSKVNFSSKCSSVAETLQVSQVNINALDSEEAAGKTDSALLDKRLCRKLGSSDMTKNCTCSVFSPSFIPIYYSNIQQISRTSSSQDDDDDGDEERSYRETDSTDSLVKPVLNNSPKHTETGSTNSLTEDNVVETNSLRNSEAGFSNLLAEEIAVVNNSAKDSETASTNLLAGTIATENNSTRNAETGFKNLLVEAISVANNLAKVTETGFTTSLTEEILVKNNSSKRAKTNSSNSLTEEMKVEIKSSKHTKIYAKTSIAEVMTFENISPQDANIKTQITSLHIINSRKINEEEQRIFAEISGTFNNDVAVFNFKEILTRSEQKLMSDGNNRRLLNKRDTSEYSTLNSDLSKYPRKEKAESISDSSALSDIELRPLEVEELGIKQTTLMNNKKSDKLSKKQKMKKKKEFLNNYEKQRSIIMRKRIKNNNKQTLSSELSSEKNMDKIHETMNTSRTSLMSTKQNANKCKFDLSKSQHKSKNERLAGGTSALAKITPPNIKETIYSPYSTNATLYHVAVESLENVNQAKVPDQKIKFRIGFFFKKSKGKIINWFRYFQSMKSSPNSENNPKTGDGVDRSLAAKINLLKQKKILSSKLRRADSKTSKLYLNNKLFEQRSITELIDSKSDRYPKPVLQEIGSEDIIVPMFEDEPEEENESGKKDQTEEEKIPGQSVLSDDSSILFIKKEVYDRLQRYGKLQYTLYIGRKNELDHISIESVAVSEEIKPIKAPEFFAAYDMGTRDVRVHVTKDLLKKKEDEEATKEEVFKDEEYVACENSQVRLTLMRGAKYLRQLDPTQAKIIEIDCSNKLHEIKICYKPTEHSESCICDSPQICKKIQLESSDLSSIVIDKIDKILDAREVCENCERCKEKSEICDDYQECSDEKCYMKIGEEEHAPSFTGTVENDETSIKSNECCDAVCARKQLKNEDNADVKTVQYMHLSQRCGFQKVDSQKEVRRARERQNGRKAEKCISKGEKKQIDLNVENTSKHQSLVRMNGTKKSVTSKTGSVMPPNNDAQQSPVTKRQKYQKLSSLHRNKDHKPTLVLTITHFKTILEIP